MSNALYPLEKLLIRDVELIERVVPWIEKTIVPYHRATVDGIERRWTASSDGGRHRAHR